jgi:hypothetical protein
MKILGVKEGTVEKPHQAIHHVAGAMRQGMIITRAKFISFVTQTQSLLPHLGLWQGV